MVGERLLQAIANAIQVPQHHYEAAKSRCQSVSRWLCRDASGLRDAWPIIYTQGSFGLGTAIRPVTDRDEYDVDLVCELLLDCDTISQAELKERLGNELHYYTKAHSMASPKEKGRCWTIQYADGDGPQFHLDVLPALPNHFSRLLGKTLGGQFPSAILITDRRHPLYKNTVQWSWLQSNPKGYSEWFSTRENLVHTAQQTTESMSLTSITPLTQAIQILKRHRDIMYRNFQSIKPTSIILTTLAAHAYRGESTLFASLTSILRGMASYFGNCADIVRVPNPVDPQENFADKWQEHPVRQEIFCDWLGKARNDFEHIEAKSHNEALSDLEWVLGKAVIDRAAKALRSRV